MNSLAILLLASSASSAAAVDYAVAISSVLRIPTPIVIVAEPWTPLPDYVPANARAWVPPDQDSGFFIRRWVVDEASDAYLHYIVLHETCHMVHRHQWEGAISQERSAEREVEADDCVRGLVSEARWKKMMKGQWELNEVALRRKRALPSAERGSQGMGGPVATPAGNRPSPSHPSSRRPGPR